MDELTSPSVNLISPSHSRFRPGYYYGIFITCDIISLILQAVGGAMSSTSSGDSTTGVNVALAGLAFQVATLAVFAALAADFFFRSRPVWSRTKLTTRFKLFVAMISLATVLLFIRCCYRVDELSQGYTTASGPLHNQGEFIGLESV